MTCTPKQETCSNPMDEDCDGHDCVEMAKLFGDSAEQYVSGVALDTKGNTYLVGMFSGTIPLGMGKTPLGGSGSGDGFLIKLDSAGDPAWGLQFGDSDAQEVDAVAVDSIGNVVIGGRSGSPITFGTTMVPAGLFVAKFDTDGQLLWGKGLTSSTGCVGSDSFLHSVAITPQKDVVVAGYYCGQLDLGDGPVGSYMGSRDGFVAKLRASDGSGKVADGSWGKVFGDEKLQSANRVAVDAMGNILVAGDFQGVMDIGLGQMTSAGGYDAFLAKLKPDGTPLWYDTINAPSGDQQAVGLAVDGAGAAILTGTFTSQIAFGFGPIDAVGTDANGYVIKYGTDNSYQWNKILPTGIPYGVATDGQADVILAGVFSGSLDLGAGALNAVSLDMFVAKLKADGTVIWNRRFGDPTAPLLGFQASVAANSAGESMVTSFMKGTVDLGRGPLSSMGGIDIFVAKFGL
jgi:hypothetical protein